MAKGFKHGAGGGAGLNFKVVGNPKPANPKENTIWVNTDQKITGWVFSVTEPEAPVEGMVWILIGTYGTASFNALKKNGIQVYPLSAYQYISGAWAKKPSEIYQDGAWVEWTFYILKANNLYGGWSTFGTLGVSKESKGIRITRSSSDFGMCIYNTKVIIGNFSTICLKYSEASGDVLQLRLNDVEYTGDTSKARVNATSGVASGTLKLSVDGLQNYKELYVAIAIVGGANGTALVEEIWFE